MAAGFAVAPLGKRDLTPPDPFWTLDAARNSLAAA